jgi:hypothetical protein
MLAIPQMAPLLKCTKLLGVCNQGTKKAVFTGVQLVATNGYFCAHLSRHDILESVAII